jgi:hydroxymethylpyrimidine pyrophosphatase-like HAD family hydrolase
VKQGVVALDYDGTIAEQGILHAAVRAAILRAREHHITLLLVTGRILDELRRVAGNLHVVDAIVAENGAVLAFPATGYSQILATAPAPTFLADLDRREVPAKHGQVVIEADTEHAAAILAVIQEQELPFTLLFNRDRVMVLPQAINKATGLRALRRTLRRSEHNAVGVGDAENDHALLESCEIGAAVA